MTETITQALPRRIRRRPRQRLVEERPRHRQSRQCRDRPHVFADRDRRPRGSGPPLHLHHNEDETFYVLEGEVTVQVGDERIDLNAGDYLFGPRGIAHTYIVRSERARMLVTASPGGIEEALRLFGVPVTGSVPPTDAVMPPMDELVRLFADYGCEILGPPLSLGDLS